MEFGLLIFLIYIWAVQIGFHIVVCVCVQVGEAATTVTHTRTEHLNVNAQVKNT